MSRGYARNLRKRIQQATWPELATRGRQEVAKRWDYARYRLGARFEAPRFDLNREVRAPRFFFSSDQLHEICQQLRQRFPQAADQIQQSADQICTHRFNLLGYENLNYGPKVDWHADVVHCKRAPMKPWFKIHYLDFDEVGDSKIIWELNRHQHLVTLAKAYLLTENSRYGEELFRLWYDWRQDNPYPIGINWASSLEVAFRTLSWIWIHHLMPGGTTMPESFPNDLLAALALHGRYIENNLSTYFSPNTHLLGEAVALFFLGTLYASIPGAERWKRKGWQIIQEHAMHQVQSDGMYFEQSLHYHVYALDFFLHARILAAANQVDIGAQFDETIIKMLEVLCTLSQSGPLPHLGDDDGGRVFDPARNRVEHLLDPLSTGAVVFGRGDFKVAGSLCEETLWLLGKNGISKFDSLAEAKSEIPAALPSSGLYVMADGSTRQQLIIDAGLLGAGRAGHAHADNLSVNVSIGGDEFLSDPGTFSYVSAVMDRGRLRGTGAHNTLRVDGLDQAEPDGPFGWRALPCVQVEMWQHAPSFDLLVANQSLSLKLSNGVLHQRTLFYLSPRFWFVRDLVTGSGEHHLDVSWHFPPKIKIVQGAAPGLFAIHACKEEPYLALLMAENQASQNQVEEDVWSPSYGKAIPSLTLHISQNRALPCEFAAVLIPVYDAASQPGRLSRLNFKEQSKVCAYAYDALESVHYLVFNDSGQGWNFGNWSSDAKFFYYETSRAGTLLRWIVSRGSFLAIDGHSLLRENELVDWRECTSCSGIIVPPTGDPASAQRDANDDANDLPLQRTVEKADKGGQR